MCMPLPVDSGEERMRFEEKNTFFGWRYTAWQKRGSAKCVRNFSLFCVEFDEDSKYVGPVTKSNGKKIKKF